MKSYFHTVHILLFCAVNQQMHS